METFSVCFGNIKYMYLKSLYNNSFYLLSFIKQCPLGPRPKTSRKFSLTDLILQGYLSVNFALYTMVVMCKLHGHSLTFNDVRDAMELIILRDRTAGKAIGSSSM
jgi:hypothetical protein